MKDKCGVENCTKSVKANMGDLKYLSHKDLFFYQQWKLMEDWGSDIVTVELLQEKCASCVLVRI